MNHSFWANRQPNREEAALAIDLFIALSSLFDAFGFAPWSDKFPSSN
jgi:hypothetical protein